MKNERQQLIVEILGTSEIHSQGELIDELRKRGVSATQATVSRDTRELCLVRQQTEPGTYRYVLPTQHAGDTEERLRNIFRECVTSITAAGNLVVIKTLPGLAPAACAAIDKMTIEDLAGTIAGDDTAFLALTSEAAAQRLCARMRGDVNR